MKRLSQVFLIVLSFFIFYQSYNAFNNDYYLEVLVPGMAFVHEGSHSIIEVKVDTSEFSSTREAVDYSQKFLKRYQLDGYILKENFQTNSLNTRIDFFILNDTLDLTKGLEFVEGTALDFDFICNDLNEKNRCRLVKYLDKSYYNLDGSEQMPLRIYSEESINDYYTETSDMIILRVVNELETLESVSELVLENFNFGRDDLTLNVFDNEMEFSLTSRDWTMNVLGNLRGLVLIFSSGLLIISVITFIKRQKEILMLRQLGATNFEVLNKVFLKDSWFFFLLILFFLLVLHLSSIYFHDNLFSRFIASFSHRYALLLVLIPLGLYGFNASMLLLFKYYYFKKRQVLSIFSVLFQVIKIGLIVSLIVPLINSAGIMKTSKENIEGFDDYPDYKAAAMIETVHFGADPTIYNQQLDLFYEVINKNRIAAYSIEDYLMYNEMGISNILREESEGVQSQYPYIVVNPYFFEDFEVYDADHQYSAKDDFKDENTVLFPNELKDKTLPFSAEVSSKTYSNPIALPNINGYLGKIVNPIIYVKQSFDSDFQYNFNMFYSSHEVMDKTITELADDGISVRKGSIEDAITRQENFSKISSLRFKEAFVISFVGIISFNLVSVFLFFEKNSKKIAIDYIFGKTFFERYRSIVVSTLLGYGAVFAIIYGLVLIGKVDGVFLSQYLLPVIVILLLIDGLIVVLNVKNDQGKIVTKCLKGGE
ncbi:hypothetical protein ERUR111494_00950 [Erysipelothrix urinaevulpis]|uniref:hypothetical protein n=1 Tax=Erysipelothrix urinaevulpis TaxID=2683717 RepID=UPI0013586927|nr:hypothetical protein [Erysipelothrix urinaevulpis]